MQTRQAKIQNPKPVAESAELTKKVASSAADSARLPAWTNAWGDQPPAPLISPIAELQAKYHLSQPENPDEQQADHIANHVMDMAASSLSLPAAPPDHPGASPLVTTSLSHVPPIIQRAPLDDSTASTPPIAESTPTPAPTTPEAAPTSTTPSPETATPALIVEDSAEHLAPGQMKKSDFLAQLQDTVCTTVEEALKGTMWSAIGCPWIEHWFGYYSNRSSSQLERAIGKYTAEAATVTSASDYIPLICDRVRRAIAKWATTGEVTGVPEGVSKIVLGTVATPAGGAAATSGTSPAASGTSTKTEGVQMKSAGDSTGNSADPQVIKGQLGEGHSLDGSTQSRMGSAFGTDFSQVRVHTKAEDAALSKDINAKAFTVGDDIAFGPGEYKPGTLVGDALLAHELAHVVQQRGATTSAPMSRSKADAVYNALEADADRSAFGVIASIWGGAKATLAGIGQNAMPQLQSGLSLRRCGDSTLKKLQKIDSARELQNNLGGLDDARLTELQKEAPAGSLLAKGILWEQAFRQRNWTNLVKYVREDTKHEFYQAYNDKIVDLVMSGQTKIQVKGDSGFTDWVKGLFIQLTDKPAGSQLVIEILAAGQQINIKKTGGEFETKGIKKEVPSPTPGKLPPLAGKFITVDDQGQPLPFEKQHRGQATGADIALNPDFLKEKVTLGKSESKLDFVGMEEVTSFGHELIHALHLSRGEDIGLESNPISEMFPWIGRVKEPITGIAESPEEIRTITGKTSFEAPSEAPQGKKLPWTLNYNLPSEGNITENMLRQERGLPERVSHLGVTRAYQVTLSTSETLSQMLDRYYMQDRSAVPPQLKVVIKEVFQDFNPFFKGNEAVPETARKELKTMVIHFPHEAYLAAYLTYIKNQPDLGKTALGLALRGAPSK